MPRAPTIADTTLVYHWTETNTPPHDSTAYGNNAEKSAIPTSGSLIGPGARLEPATSVSIPNSDSLTWREGASFTWSVWVKLGAGSNGALLSRSANGTGVVLGVEDNTPYFELAGQRARGTTKLDANWLAPSRRRGRWHAGNAVRGRRQSRQCLRGRAGDDRADRGGGKRRVEFAGGRLRDRRTGILQSTLAPGFLNFAATTQGAEKDSKLVTFAADEKKHSWLSGGFVGIILGSLTVDGWIVIGILAVMSVISWW